MNERKQNNKKNDRKERAYIKRRKMRHTKKIFFLCSRFLSADSVRDMKYNKKKLFVCSFEGNLWTRGTFESWCHLNDAPSRATCRAVFISSKEKLLDGLMAWGHWLVMTLTKMLKMHAIWMSKSPLSSH